MRVDWRGLAALCNSVVDTQWGEPVEIVPWKSGTYAVGAANQNRPVTQTVGELFFSADDVTRLGGLDTPLVEADVRLSLPQAAVDASGAKQGDRVNMLDRSGTDASFEIDRVLPDGTGRAMIHLLRLKT